MGHISYFSALSNYSLQAGNWHPSPSMYVLLLDPEPSGMGGSLDPTDLGSGLLPRPGCPPPTHPTLHPPPPRPSLSPLDHSPQGLLPRPGCPHPSHSLSSPLPATDRSPQGLPAPPQRVQPSLREPWVFPMEGHSFPQQVPTKGTTELWLLDTWYALSPHIWWGRLITVEMIQAPPPDPKFSTNLQQCRVVDIASRPQFLMTIFLDN